MTNAFALLHPATTLPHGTIFRPVPNGFRLQRPDRSTLGRIAVRKRKDGTAWYAVCDGWDGYTWTRDRFISRPTIDQLEAAIREYAINLDNHAHACSSPA
jgi:hypothetical protein